MNQVISLLSILPAYQSTIKIFRLTESGVLFTLRRMILEDCVSVRRSQAGGRQVLPSDQFLLFIGSRVVLQEREIR